MKRKIGLEKLCRISIDQHVYIFSDVRDFRWKTAENAERNFIDYLVRKKDIQSCDLYLDRFGWQKVAGHIILVFTFSTGEQLALSVEARLQDGEPYSFWKGLLWQYPIVAIWGTAEDILGLRKVRGDKLAHYPLQIKKRELQTFFENLIAESDYLNSNEVWYHAITNNCTSAVWKVVSKTFNIDFWQWQIFFPGFVDKLMVDMGLVKKKDVNEGT